jgi:hypothetical protein
MMDQAAGTLMAFMLISAIVYGWRNKPAEIYFFWFGWVVSLIIVAWRLGCWSHYLTCAH